MNIGEKIKTLRFTKNLTQEALAKTIGISVTAFGDIERGNTKDITISRIEQIAKALNVSPKDLLDEKSDEHKDYNYNGYNYNNDNHNRLAELVKAQSHIIENYKDIIAQKEKEVEQCKQQLNKTNKGIEKTD